MCETQKRDYTAWAVTRIAPHEKKLIEACAQRDGYASTSDWIRARLRDGIRDTLGEMALR